jgi:hypothetical protein
MEYFAHKSDLGRLVGVLFAHFQHERKGAALPGRVVRPKNNCLPNHNVGLQGGSINALGWIAGYLLKVTNKALCAGVFWGRGPNAQGGKEEIGGGAR